MKCSKCSKEIDDNSEFCIYCGENFRKKLKLCKYCNAELLNDAFFCKRCGKEIVQEQESIHRNIVESKALKHPILGTVSFIIALVSIIIYGIFTIFSLIIDLYDPYFESMGAILLGLLILSMMLINLTGIIFGIIGLKKKHTKKAFSTTGIVLNSIIIFSMIIITIAYG